MVKRKLSEAKDAEQPDVEAPRRSSRNKPSATLPETSKGSHDGLLGNDVKGGAKRAARSKKQAAGKKKKTEEASGDDNDDDADQAPSERQYWLMKAEPESRLENGVDVKFSIDDLASKTSPEPWDGIRNYVARNNLRAMRKGDLAFFYHSNCKEPAIVGTMEDVSPTNSVQVSAHDPKTPYYDGSSKPSDPKWSVVHVQFRTKFAEPIGLKELKTMKPLENMQMLKQSRLSVSKVSAEEWEFLMHVAEQKAEVKTKAIDSTTTT